MKEMWNERYGAKEFAYGIAPNVFFKYALDKYELEGRILLPAEGEGRNALYAAQSSLEVYAFDISEEGQKKALQLAKEHHLTIDYQVGHFLKMNYAHGSFDAAALIYAHFPPHILSVYHQKIIDLLKPGALLVLEGFSTNNLPLRMENPKVGGPDKIEMLFSTESIKAEFPNFETIELEEAQVELNEGLYHQGKAKVIRFVGKKNA
ncbi:MAG: class I SAM-dependent methyltransferase [Flavobacteriales bacterium]|nr:class I SAM-dependent methyltransferase [Flavobacteriales bacterium]